MRKFAIGFTIEDEANEVGQKEDRIMKSRFVIPPIALLFVIAMIGCNRPHRYPMQGEVVAKNAATNEMTVSHGDIPGFMDAMAMPYRVKDPAIIQEIQPGDKIAAEVVVNGNDRTDYWLENVRITDKSGRGKMRTPPGSSMLAPGAHVPDITLTNQDGRKIRFSDFAGKAVLVTFIYTRCPMPDFCPRLNGQFEQIHNELKKHAADYAKTHLLTISFDPKHDTPSVLRNYGLNYLGDDANGFKHWEFASTNADGLVSLSRAFGLQYSEDDDGLITHTMNVVLIAPDGTVANYWGTTWTWRELLQSLLCSEQTAGKKPGDALQRRGADPCVTGAPITIQESEVTVTPDIWLWAAFLREA